MTKKNKYRAVSRFRGYSPEGIECTLCLHYRNKKVGCGYDVCLYEDERLDIEARSKTNRRRSSGTQWDG